MVEIIKEILNIEKIWYLEKIQLRYSLFYNYYNVFIKYDKGSYHHDQVKYFSVIPI